MEVVMKLVESPPYYEPPQHHAQSRPTLGFPLGTALLLIIIFSLSGFFSCCYHWDKLRHLRGSYVDHNADESSPTKPNVKLAEIKEVKKESLPVIMAGDRIAKFMALPCPREPPREHKINLQEELETPQKSPHIIVHMN
ncbi:uncharacterized protein At5g65660-like [Rutidosis leptorrhynchoides]|uniref:uncharacterized protein At5g65660-like n=1 Tax=Rutidosis leptorrhynchoides TaxID=125765 RepID=UPI003A9A2AC2